MQTVPRYYFLWFYCKKVDHATSVGRVFFTNKRYKILLNWMITFLITLVTLPRQSTNTYCKQKFKSIFDCKYLRTTLHGQSSWYIHSKKYKHRQVFSSEFCTYRIISPPLRPPPPPCSAARSVVCLDIPSYLHSQVISLTGGYGRMCSAWKNFFFHGVV